MKYNLGFNNTGNPQKVCGAANLLRNLKSITACRLHCTTEFQDGFPNKKEPESTPKCKFKPIHILLLVTIHHLQLRHLIQF